MGDKKIMAGVLLFANILFAIGIWGNRAEASELKIEDAKNGIVAVQAGVKSYDGKFYQIKSASGFVVCNEQGSVYIVTTNHSVSVTDEEKKAVCEKNKMDDASGLDVEVRILVEGDVPSDVTVKTASAQEDFCILEAEDVLNTKTPLRLSDDREMAIGDSVYMLGFSEKPEGSSGYGSGDVEIHAGTVQDTAALMGGSAYMQHSAVIMPAQSGGALLNKSGYLVGMGNSAVTNKGINAYYALPISKIRSILDNYGIAYGSRERDEMLFKLEKAYQECREQCESGQYKNDSVEALKAAMQKIGGEDALEKMSMEELEKVQDVLDQGRESLVRKASKWMVAKYILLPVLLILSFLVLHACLRYRNLHRPLDSPGLEQLKSAYSDEGTVILRDDRGAHGHHEIKGSENPDAFHGRRACLVSQATGGRCFISKKVFSIGKNPDNDFQLGRETVSRKHAVILWREGSYYIKDLDSANGTYVNGNVVGNGTVHLVDGARVSLAEEEFEFITKEGMRDGI